MSFLEGESDNPETPKKKFVLEEFLTDAPIGKEGVHIKRVQLVPLNSGTDVRVNLSISDRINREGWNVQRVEIAKKGDMLRNRDGEAYEVMEVKRGKEVIVRHIKDDYLGRIPLTPLSVKAHEYKFRIYDSLGKPKEIKVHDLIFKDRSENLSAFLNDLVGSIPAQHFNAIDEIRLDFSNGRHVGKARVESSILGERGVIHLYLNPDSTSEDISAAAVLEDFYHELGHVIISAVRGNAHPGPRWTRAKRADGNEMSEYSSKARSVHVEGDNGEVEDSAEAFVAYLSSDGAKDSKFGKLRAACQNRFEELDRLFENPVNQEIMNTNRLIRKLLGRRIE